MKKSVFYCICNLIIFILIYILFSTPIYANQYRETTDLNNFDENKYPGYKERILALKQEHPNWDFTFFYTGLKWDTVVYNETTAYHGRSLIQNKSGEWLCSDCGTKIYDGSNWYCASVKAVSYYLDPRNFLTSDNIFQFEALSYVENAYTEAGVEAILNGTFMSNSTIRNFYNNENYTDKKFSFVILEAGREAGISPYHIASRLKQEIIVSGGGPSNSVTGTVSEYEGYYNFFNIGASGGQGAVERGLKYAKSKEWNNPEFAIKDGAKILAANYISKGQNTLYLEKFDVDDSNNSIYSHQYMQNIQAPTSEGKRIKTTYQNLGMLDNYYNFIIPVYENMPVNISELPQETREVLSGEIMKVIANGSLTLRAEPTTNSTAITSLPTGTLVTRIEKSVANANGYVWDKIKTIDGKVGFVATKYLEFVQNNTNNNTNNNSNVNENALNENKIAINEEKKLVECSPKITIKEIKDYFDGKQITAKYENGEVINNENISIGTGAQIIIDNSSYIISKFGDINGDGKVKASDYVLIKNYIMGEGQDGFNDAKSVAADINKDGQIKASDYVLIKNYIMSQ